MKNHSTQRGFTIIETLVAITVLMIAIAGPLAVASKGLFGADLAKDQMIASYLAQESMESLKNIRDNNIYNGSDWLSGIGTCTRNSPCDVSAIDGVSNNPSVVNGCNGPLPCPIYLETNGYGHVNGAGARATKFTRYLYVHDTQSYTDACTSSDECSVAVEVYWTEGNLSYSIVLSSQITSSIR
jgi:prepilin-type N-terminal cleavage/methylation domain-containing protein